MEELIQLLGGGLGALGFTVVFNIRRQKAALASLGGVLSWGVYLLAGLAVEGEVLRYFLASVAVTIYSEIMARVSKCPATVFLVIGSIPLIPGGALYRTMAFFMRGEYTACLTQGLTTIMIAVAIAVGMLFPMSVSQLLRRGKVLMSRNKQT